MMKINRKVQLSQPALLSSNKHSLDSRNRVIANRTSINLHVSNLCDINQSVCICMLLKNLEVSPVELLKRLDIFRSMFKKSYVIFVSTYSDNTYYSTYSNSTLLTIADNSDTVSRNAYLNIFLQHANWFDLLCVVDPNIVFKNDLNLSSLSSLLPQEIGGWDVLFANQSYKYYDTDELVKTEEDLNRDPLNKKKLYQYHIPSDFGRMRVKSAFGGLAFYKQSCITSDNSYKDDGHISFNLQISTNTPKMFIDSSMVIETHPSNAKLYI